jgi:hypothetical protein
VQQQPTTYVNPTQPLNNYSYPQQPMDNYGSLATTSSTTNTPTYNTSMFVANYAAPAVTSTVQAPQQPTYASYTSQYYPTSNTDLSNNQNLSQQTPTMSYSESTGIIHHQQQQQKYPTVDSNSVPVSTSLYSLNQSTAVTYPAGYNAPVNTSNQAYNPYQVRPYIYKKQSDRSRQNKTKSISFFSFGKNQFKILSFNLFIYKNGFQCYTEHNKIPNV